MSLIKYPKLNRKIHHDPCEVIMANYISNVIGSYVKTVLGGNYANTRLLCKSDPCGRLVHHTWMIFLFLLK